MSPAPSALPAWLAEDMERIENILLGIAGASTHPLVAEPATHLIKAGGKRLRPALVLMTSGIAEPTDATDLAAAAIELVHLATLYHDDVLDETDVRRGVPTAHSKWGVEVAVLAGDYLFACGSSLGAAAGGEVPGILAQAIADVCEGQIVETGALNEPTRPVTEYLETIDKKTGALFRAACELGASTSGAGADQRQALMSYGEHLGRAFQMIDDLLDLIGDPEVTGKIPGTDLKEGVFTMAVLVGSERRPELARSLSEGKRDLSDVLPVLQESGALAVAQEAAAAEGEQARAALAGLPPSRHLDALHALVDAVLTQIPSL